MARSKKATRDKRIVMYLRVRETEHAKIAKIAEERGHPHTIASVAAEMISKSLKRKILVVDYDVTGLTDAQIGRLTMEAVVQGEASEGLEEDNEHPDVKVTTRIEARS
jgi:L-fucose mutarotase/ribose pyranase (RbsD/FucU family)